MRSAAQRSAAKIANQSVRGAWVPDFSSLSPHYPLGGYTPLPKLPHTKICLTGRFPLSKPQSFVHPLPRERLHLTPLGLHMQQSKHSPRMTHPLETRTCKGAQHNPPGTSPKLASSRRRIHPRQGKRGSTFERCSFRMSFAFTGNTRNKPEKHAQAIDSICLFGHRSTGNNADSAGNTRNKSFRESTKVFGLSVCAPRFGTRCPSMIPHDVAQRRPRTTAHRRHPDTPSRTQKTLVICTCML